MNKRVVSLALVFGLAGVVSVGCGSDDDSTPSHGGAGGVAGGAGKAGSGGKGGAIGNAGSGNESGSGDEGPAGSGGTDQGGSAGEGGSLGGEGGEGGAGPKYTAAQIQHGTVIVRSLAQCGSCHTASGGPELGGNTTFAGSLGAPNLTNDPTGIADFSDEEVINAFRNGIALRKTSTDEARQLSAVMPYWLFHNMSDADALATVAFLRSLPPATFTVVTDKPVAAAAPPLDPSTLPASSFMPADAEYAAAQRGKYLVSGVAQCIKCHSPANTSRLPIPDFFSGVPPTATPATAAFASNITPDVATGIGGWLAADVKTALKVGTNKGGESLCSPMPSGSRGYAGISDDDALAIGVYLTSIPGINKSTSAPDLEPVCTP